jgi:hypothetical protein
VFTCSSCHHKRASMSYAHPPPIPLPLPLPAVQSEMSNVYAKHGVNPFKGFIAPLVQAPLFISFFYGLRKMADYYPSINNGGALWFTDLTVADPTMILPIISLGSMLVTIELSGSEMGEQAQAQMFKNGFRLLIFCSFPFVYQFPSALFVYWVRLACLDPHPKNLYFFVLRSSSVVFFLSAPTHVFATDATGIVFSSSLSAPLSSHPNQPGPRSPRTAFPWAKRCSCKTLHSAKC